MPTYGIEPQTRIYKIRVIPLNYAGEQKITPAGIEPAYPA
jgi:hypothetical protein